MIPAPGSTHCLEAQRLPSGCEPAASVGTCASWTSVLAGIAFSVTVALGLYACTVAFLIDPYILKGSEAGRVMGVYHAYQHIKAKQAEGGPRQELVLFWGSSMIREA